MLTLKFVSTDSMSDRAITLPLAVHVYLNLCPQTELSLYPFALHVYLTNDRMSDRAITLTLAVHVHEQGKYLHVEIVYTCW